MLEAPAGLIRVRADLRRRQGDRRDVPQRAGVRDPPRRPDRGPAARHRDGGRGVRRDVLRHRRRGGARVPAGARRGPRHHPGHGDDQGGGARAAAGRPPGAARVRRRSRSAQLSGPAHDPRNSWRNVVDGVHGRARLDRGRRPGPASSTARRAAPERARRWPSSMRRAASGLDEDFRHEGILGTVFTGRLVEETQIGDRTAVVPTITGHRRGSRGSRPTSWTRPTRSRRATRSANLVAAGG